ncbi:hypothetical protein HDU85_002624 [Gaertneriomyces sp. JEL0708]|nr:hypothetical protein HDU85_002624 [Gaertneriomyces sp. JEL0708]
MENSDWTPQRLSSFTLKELRVICKDVGVGVGKKNKAQLVESLTAWHNERTVEDTVTDDNGNEVATVTDNRENTPVLHNKQRAGETQDEGNEQKKHMLEVIDRAGTEETEKVESADEGLPEMQSCGNDDMSTSTSSHTSPDLKSQPSALESTLNNMAPKSATSLAESQQEPNTVDSPEVMESPSSLKSVTFAPEPATEENEADSLVNVGSRENDEKPSEIDVDIPQDIPSTEMSVISEPAASDKSNPVSVLSKKRASISASSLNGIPTVTNFLAQNNMQHLTTLFRKEELMDWTLARELTVDTLRSMGVKTGSAIKYCLAVKQLFPDLAEERAALSLRLSVSVDSLQSLMDEMSSLSLTGRSTAAATSTSKIPMKRVSMVPQKAMVSETPTLARKQSVKLPVLSPTLRQETKSTVATPRRPMNVAPKVVTRRTGVTGAISSKATTSKTDDKENAAAPVRPKKIGPAALAAAEKAKRELNNSTTAAGLQPARPSARTTKAPAKAKVASSKLV